jgi:predicted transport protein
MSDIKLFRRQGSAFAELAGSSAPLEKALQTLFEKNLDALLGVRFVASEYVTSHGGRMDTLGLDENGSPVIIEYKRTSSENVINQGLFYLDWLLDHRGDFEVLVMKTLGGKAAEQIEWTAPRLICIAADFTKYDTHAVNQMGRNIELVRYKTFGDDLLTLELLTAVSATPSGGGDTGGGYPKPVKYKTVSDSLADADTDLANLYADLDAHLTSIGDEVIKKTLQFYIAYRRIKNFACVEIKPQLGVLRVYLKVDPTTVEIENGFTRDVRKVGHFGTGDLEVTIRSHADLERAKPLIAQSYEAS